MTICPRCNKENDINNRFCGYCGTNLLTTNAIVDGKKDKRQLRFLNNLFKNTSFNIIYIVVCLLLLFLAVSFSIYFIKGFNLSVSGFSYHINQIMAKFSYIIEGMPFSYIYSSIVYILHAVIFFIFGITMIIDIPILLFYIAFGCYIFYYRRKNNMYMKKPVAVLKLKIMITKYSLTFNIVVFLIIIALLLATLYLGGI